MKDSLLVASKKPFTLILKPMSKDQHCESIDVNNLVISVSAFHSDAFVLQYINKNQNRIIPYSRICEIKVNYALENPTVYSDEQFAKSKTAPVE